MNGERRSVPLRGLLSMVNAMGGRLESRIRLQKSAYLLRAAGVRDFRGTTFKYHHYGPYSRPLSDTLQEAVVSDLLREERSEYKEEQSKYTYELTPAGRAWLEENGESDDVPVQQLAPLFRDTPWRSLELAATVLFLEEDEKLGDRANAMARALLLKPACAEYRDTAEELLRSIGL